jgi:transcriptional regulator GlxA family with amidase domain
MAILPLALSHVEQHDASMKIDVIVFDGFDELDALGPYEVLCNAVQGGADADVGLAATGGPGPITGSHGATVLAQRAPDHADLVIVPGGGWMDGNPQGLRAQIADGTLARLLDERHAAGATVAGVCTGVMLLASAGLLEGRRAITHAGAIPDLEAAGAEIVHARVVDDGDVVTAGGVTSGLDLALDLVERFWGAALADGVAGDMEYQRRSSGTAARVAA